jgi:hypothetical protein
MIAVCRCGNTLGEPRVSPYPVTIVTIEDGPLALRFLAGFVGEKCWFCAFPR